jgi:hypothetical protein
MIDVATANVVSGLSRTDEPLDCSEVTLGLLDCVEVKSCMLASLAGQPIKQFVLASGVAVAGDVKMRAARQGNFCHLQRSLANPTA